MAEKKTIEVAPKAGAPKPGAPKAVEPKPGAPKAVESKAVEPKAEPAKVEAPAEAKSEASKNYSRGEGQKAVTQAYKDNWNAIYGKKKKKKR
jgi:hypothetical protein